MSEQKLGFKKTGQGTSLGVIVPETAQPPAAPVTPTPPDPKKPRPQTATPER